MSTSAQETRNPSRPEQPSAPEQAVVRNWRHAVIFTVLAVVTLLVCGLGSVHSDVVFRLAEAKDAVRLPDVHLSSVATGWTLGLVTALMAVLAWITSARGLKVPLWCAVVFWAAFVIAMLVWAVSRADSNSLSLPGLLAGSLTLAVPLVFGSMSGLLCERSGVVNIAIEGQLLFGAFAAAVAGSVAHNAWVGLVAAMLGSVLVSLVLASFSIKYLVNQVIVGVVVNVLVSGLTGFLYSTVLSRSDAGLNAPEHLPSFAIPFLSEIPVIGPVLFDQSVIVYLMYLVVFLLWYGLARTRWGLRTRAVGEHPKAADTLGVKVNRLRFWNVLLAGAVAGMGGAFFTLVSVSSFNKDMTAGQGYIALAALIFGRWRPFGALFAALLFGFATNLQSVLSLLGTTVPSQFLAMLPYLVTLAAVTGLVGRSRGPAASGVPYVKE